jgi:pimeloyl-ACP methyl ester carboxylesterase
MAGADTAHGVPSPSGSRPSRRSRIRIAIIVVVALAALAFGGFTGYAVIIGSDDLLHPGKVTDCRTPETAYGWPYEAINYDAATDAALHPVAPVAPSTAWTCEGTPAPAGTEVVTPDGMRLAGWYIPAAAGHATDLTILLVHGRGSNKSEYLRYAVPLHEAYNVVLFDQRGAGQSSDAPNTLGVLEQQDVRAELDWLEAAKHPSWIAVVGTSMGASTVLAVAVDDQRIRALVLDSMHARIATGIARGIERDTSFPAFPSQPASFFGARLRTGVDLSSADPIDMIGRLRDRPVLLIHGSADAYDIPAESLVPNVSAAVAAGVEVDVRVCHGVGHDDVIDGCPAAWTAWVRTFLDGVRVEEGLASP